MREVRFRLWDKEHGIMVYNFSDDFEFIAHNGKTFEINEWSSYGGGGFELDEVSSYRVLMQFTGLYDRYGGRVYEGDIIKFETFGDFYEYSFYAVSEVYWNEKQFRYMVRGQHGNALSHLLRENLEVIGNIYEQPHLLEEATT